MGILLNLNLKQGIKVILYLHTFFKGFFLEFLDDFFGGMFMEEFFGRIFWEDFFGGIFWEDFFGRNFFGEEFFGRNFLGGIICLKLFEYERD